MGSPGTALVLAAAVSLLPSIAHADFVVASRERGIVRVSDRGVVREVLSATHASRGVMRNAHVVLFLVDGELRELDLETHVERVVATLPGDVGLGCGGLWSDPASPASPYLVETALQFERSMVADDARACSRRCTRSGRSRRRASTVYSSVRVACRSR